MMSLQTTQNINREAAIKAAATNRYPFTFEAEDVGIIDSLRAIPFLGDHLPTNWRRKNITTKNHVHGLYNDDNDGHGAWMVDSSGIGGFGEPALMIEEFLDMIQAGHSYAIVEAGQFQIKIGEFEKVPKPKTPRKTSRDII